MIKLNLNGETIKMLNELVENENHFWRMQEVKFNGIIPMGHQSHERIYGEEPEFMENGVSCFDNPFQLINYTLDELISDSDFKEMEIVIFTGKYLNDGLDNEDIVEILDENAVDYTISALDFYKWLMNYEEEFYVCGEDAREKYLDFPDSFKEEILNK